MIAVLPCLAQEEMLSSAQKDSEVRKSVFERDSVAMAAKHDELQRQLDAKGGVIVSLRNEIAMTRSALDAKEQELHALKDEQRRERTAQETSTMQQLVELRSVVSSS